MRNSSLMERRIFGKTKIDIPLGVGRIEGELRVDDGDPSKSHVDLHIYPATSMTPTIGEEGTFKKRWLASISKNMANQTLMCFHSKEVVRTPDGKLQTKGELSVVRVDRNVEIPAPSEAYYGPVYGDPVIHRVAKEATFVFDAPASASADNGRREQVNWGGGIADLRLIHGLRMLVF